MWRVADDLAWKKLLKIKLITSLQTNDSEMLSNHWKYMHKLITFSWLHPFINETSVGRSLYKHYKSTFKNYKKYWYVITTQMEE